MELKGVLKIHETIKQKSPRPVTDGPINEGKITGILDKATFAVYGHEKYTTPFQKAACILEGICRLHPFTDGNKRTAFYSAYAFLQQRGLHFDMKLAESSYLVHIASVKEQNTEEQIDMLINEAADWLSHRIVNSGEKI